MFEAILGHQFTASECALVSGKEVVNVHGPWINVFQIRAFQREDSRVWTIQFRVLAHEVSSVIGGLEIFTLAGANIHLVITSCAIEQPVRVCRTVEISE